MSGFSGSCTTRHRLRDPKGASIVALLVVLTVLPACSIKNLAINGVADTLADSGALFAADDDPELIRDAIPFGLKTIEGLLAELPEHQGLLLSACRGFTQYSFAFVETDAELLQYEDYDATKRMRERALKLYLRARDYGLRGLEVKHSGILQRLTDDPETAVAGVSVEEIDMLYWTAAAWGAALSLGGDRPELIADLPTITAIVQRVMDLDEAYEDGAVHEMFVRLESLGDLFGGSLDQARTHFERALELSGGHSASPYLTMATNVSVTTQNRDEFEELLEQALAIDLEARPEIRLQNIIVQRRAQHLLDNVEELFF
jgi:predicted anti-sigma-YlaC factor YlaD